MNLWSQAGQVFDPQEGINVNKVLVDYLQSGWWCMRTFFCHATWFLCFYCTTDDDRMRSTAAETSLRFFRRIYIFIYLYRDLLWKTFYVACICFKGPDIVGFYLLVMLCFFTVLNALKLIERKHWTLMLHIYNRHQIDDRTSANWDIVKSVWISRK